jgi:hypothetical protein
VYARDFVFYVPEGVEETEVRRWLQIIEEKKRMRVQVRVFVCG